MAQPCAFLHRTGLKDIEHLYRRSQALKAGRAAGQALLLSDILYGTLEGSELRHQLKKDRTIAWLSDAALRQLASPYPTEPTERWFGTMTIHLTQFGLLPGRAFKVAELRRQLSDLVLAVTKGGR